MAQPIGSVLENTTDEQPTCPDAVPFCIGDCDTWDDGNGNTQHGTGFAWLTVESHNVGETELSVSASRTDTNYVKGPAEVHLITGNVGDDLTLTPNQARKLAAMILNSADAADPVQIRRAMHPTDEPTLTKVEVPKTTAKGWCARCRADRDITGQRIVSATGVIRVRGRCGTCNKQAQNAFIGLADWAVDSR